MSKPMTMVERVAMAIACRMHDGGDFGMQGADAHEARPAEFAALARSAIEAMPIPTAAMLAAMWNVKFPGGGSMGETMEHDNKGEQDLQFAWAAGIDAALSEEGE